MEFIMLAAISGGFETYKFPLFARSVYFILKTIRILKREHGQCSFLLADCAHDFFCAILIKKVFNSLLINYIRGVDKQKKSFIIYNVVKN